MKPAPDPPKVPTLAQALAIAVAPVARPAAWEAKDKHPRPLNVTPATRKK